MVTGVSMVVADVIVAAAVATDTIRGISVLKRMIIVVIVVFVLLFMVRVVIVVLATFTITF